MTLTRTKKYIQNKHTNRKNKAIQDIKTKEDIKNDTSLQSLSIKQEKSSIKQKTSIKKRMSSNRIKKMNSGNAESKKMYTNRMKFLGISKKQKKMKKTSQRTNSIFRKGVSVTGKSVKVAFKTVTKTVTAVNHLASIGSALILLVIITLFIGIFASLSSDSGIETSTLPLISAEVLEYTETIRKYAEKNNIEDYVSLIQAVMMQESGGKGTDPMQSSECEYNIRYPKKPNGIQDSEYSIEIGVKYFSDCLKESKVKDSTDMQKIYLALQGYNYGKGYINWAVANFNGDTRANAKVYSDDMKAKLQVDVYGDPNYVNHVLQYYHISNNGIVKVALAQLGNLGGKTYWSWYGFESRVEWCASF